MKEYCKYELHGRVGVCDASCEMHRLHDVLQYFETSLKIASEYILRSNNKKDTNVSLCNHLFVSFANFISSKLGSRFQAKVIRILEDEDKVANMVAGHGCWSIGPKLFQPEP